ncbi:hypothetical protein RO3G_15167 [Rhizopus delemar RA 99-880]|uniref:Tc1-like transposase DDE domain-containing protein n=2 Tax=Rhizopus delemar (strain RA 99-880 / ATCC MYA-4621 / FGSC 9543 / NRRL 43880) TaxID=246409 RepID=I1CPS6_RHIO9|nr:hypothetical protein RO3G_15167 [Rhizopus delemar RA 99-880]KAG1166455.1 hypothetical protein G6F36_012940 [Rhizopus arrhizus]|eukprot:EIE90456.1 hypothetical protein RO3G_15167 [Rhizopus delemar RA 99-880]
MSQFIIENGKGEMFNENGDKISVLQMEVDDPNFPLGDVTNYDEYHDLKPPEKQKVEKNETTIKKKKANDLNENDASTLTTHRKYKKEDMEYFFYLVNEKGMSIRAAAKKMNIPQSTAWNWHKKGEEALDDFVEWRKSGSGRPVGRPPKLTNAHRDFLVKLVDENDTGLTLNQMMESLTTEFMGLEISKSAFHEFAKTKCRISCKRAHFQPEERNNLEKIQLRYDWVKHWESTDLDFESNCVFIDEAGFHINMKRSFAWSKVGTRAVVKTPKTKSKMTTILGAISPFGVVNMKVRTPKVVQSKKRKLGGNKEDERDIDSVKRTVGTVTGHYFNFIANTLDVMDRHEEFKGHYIVMDNAPIHKHEDIKLYIESRGYNCVHLPPYSPELNPIEQFWSVCKSKLKREALLQEETLTSRIKEACNSVLISDLKGFCRYSQKKFDNCLERKPI